MGKKPPSRKAKPEELDADHATIRRASHGTALPVVPATITLQLSKDDVEIICEALELVREDPRAQALLARLEG